MVGIWVEIYPIKLTSFIEFWVFDGAVFVECFDDMFILFHGAKVIFKLDNLLNMAKFKADIVSDERFSALTKLAKFLILFEVGWILCLVCISVV